MCMERRRFSQTIASEWQTALMSHRMPWCAFLTAVKNTTKVLINCKTFSSRPRPRPRPNVQDQDQDFMIQDQDQDQDFHFVLEAPRDEDPGLEDYITGKNSKDETGWITSTSICQITCFKLLSLVNQGRQRFCEKTYFKLIRRKLLLYTLVALFAMKFAVAMRRRRDVVG